MCSKGNIHVPKLDDLTAIADKHGSRQIRDPQLFFKLCSCSVRHIMHFQTRICEHINVICKKQEK